MDIPKNINNSLFNKFPPENIGLFHGKTGLLFYYYLYSRKNNSKEIEAYADQLLEDIIEQLTLETPINFSEGLCGIGYILEYLIENQYITTESNTILSELDKQMFRTLIYNETNLSLLNSIGHYYCYRLCHNNTNNKATILYIKQNLIYLIDEIERKLITSDVTNILFPKTLSYSFDITWQYPWLIDLIGKLSTLKIFPHKLKKLRNILLNFLYKYNDKRHPGNEMLLFTVLTRYQLKYSLPYKVNHIPSFESFYLHQGLAGYLSLLYQLPLNSPYLSQIPIIEKTLRDFLKVTLNPQNILSISDLSILDGIMGIELIVNYYNQIKKDLLISPLKQITNKKREESEISNFQKKIINFHINIKDTE